MSKEMFLLFSLLPESQESDEEIASHVSGTDGICLAETQKPAIIVLSLFSLSFFFLFVHPFSLTSLDRDIRICVLTNFFSVTTVNKLGHFRRRVARKLFVIGPAATPDVVPPFHLRHIERTLELFFFSFFLIFRTTDAFPPAVQGGREITNARHYLVPLLATKFLYNDRSRRLCVFFFIFTIFITQGNDARYTSLR